MVDGSVICDYVCFGDELFCFGVCVGCDVDFFDCIVGMFMFGVEIEG